MQENFLSKLEKLAESGELYKLADEVYSATDIVRHLDYSVNGKRISDVVSILTKYEVDTTHWTPNGKPRVTRLSKNCPVCGIKFTFFEREPRTTCSYSCSNTYFRSKENNPNWIDGKSKYRSKALSHYENVCVRCGFTDIRALVVHHKDRNRNNSDLNNLEILCCNCHSIEHKLDQ